MPALIYFNHQTGDDPIIVSYLLLKYLSQRKNVIMPTSHDYWRLLGKQPHYAAAVRAAQKFLGWQMPPIIQSYRTRGTDVFAKKIQAEELVKDFIILLKEKIPHGATVVIAPEGHRSRTGKLLPAERGAGIITTMMKDSGLVLPIALRYPKTIGYGLNFNFKISPEVLIICGPLMEANQVINQTFSLNQNSPLSSRISHFLMWQLAQSLPEEMKGVYHPSFFSRTLTGDFYLKPDKKTGRVGVWDRVNKLYLPDIY